MLAPLTDSEIAALLLSLRVGLAATLVGVVPAALLAYWLARTASRLRTAVEVLVILPMVLPPVVVGYFLLVLLGRRGWIGAWLYDLTGGTLAFTWQGAAAAALALGLPLMVRTMRQAFEAVDPGLEQAAATLGAGRPGVFVAVTLPLALRGCIAGAFLCFARSLGEFGATITFAGNIEGETRTLPLAIWSALQRAGGEDTAWRLTWISAALAVLATVACELLVRRSRRGAPDA